MSTLSIGKRRFLSKIGIRKLSTTEAAEIDKDHYDKVLLPLAQKLKNDLLATPNADVTALEGLMTKAANEASNGKYDKAVATLEAKAVKKAYALAKVTAQGASKKQQTEALYRVKYGERKQKLEDAINVLRTMPGTGDVQEELRNNKTAGERLAATSPPDYEKAFNALGKVEDKLKDALKASKESLKAANAIPEVKAALQTFETHFQELETLAPDEELQEIKAAQVAVLALISSGKKKNKTDKEAAADCANGLDQVTNQVLKRITELKKSQESYTRNAKDITKKLKSLEDCSTVLTRAPYEDRLKRAATLIAQRRFDQAAELVKADVADLQKKLDTWPAARQAWEEQRPVRAKIMTALKELAECPATEEMHEECSAELERLRSMAKDEREDSYDIARQGVEDLKLLIEGLKADVLVPYGKLSKVRKAADKKVQEAYDEVEAALKEVQQRIQMGGGPDNADFGDFNQRLADAFAEWQTTSRTALQADDLNTDEKVAELKKIGQELDAAASDLDTYTRYADEATTKAEKTEYDKVRAQVDQALKGISELGGETINTLLIEVQGLYKKTDADKKYSAATTRLRDQVLGQIQRLKNTFGPDLERYAGEARQAQTEASQAVKTLQNKLGDSKYKGLFKSLQEELSDLTLMIESTNLDTVKGAKKEIAAFKQRLATLAQNLTGKDPAAKNFQKIEAEISTITDTLDNANLKKWRAAQFDAVGWRQVPPSRGAPAAPAVRYDRLSRACCWRKSPRSKPCRYPDRATSSPGRPAVARSGGCRAAAPAWRCWAPRSSRRRGRDRTHRRCGRTWRHRTRCSTPARSRWAGPGRCRRRWPRSSRRGLRRTGSDRRTW